ncbi:unnamed protein product [Nezara viridula]|uniref:Uncharacterized protein n=1 Tax=Nezara viridula TaxID=85310 RepID=A0A9P0MU48_NEZVI|nr:unnamed protein product [Nezara viridula]
MPHHVLHLILSNHYHMKQDWRCSEGCLQWDSLWLPDSAQRVAPTKLGLSLQKGRKSYCIWNAL